MPITGNDANKGAGVSEAFGGVGQPTPEATAQSQTTTNKAVGGEFSWNNLYSYGSHSMARTPIGETLSKTLAAMEDRLKKQQQANYEVKLIPMDRKDYSLLPASVIVLALKDKTVGQPVVSAHTFILEGSVEPWGAKPENYNGMVIEVQRPTSEAWKAGTVQIVADELGRIYPGHRILSAEAEVVPRTTNIEDPDQVYSMLANGMLAVESRLFELQGRSELNLAKAKNDSSLTVRVNYLSNQAQQLDPVGLPLRSDIELATIVTQNNQAQVQQYGQQQLLESQKEIGYVSGYVDTIWDPVQTNNLYGQAAVPQFGNQVMPDGTLLTAKVRAMFVITDSRVQDVSSLTAQIFSLFPALLLRENDQWQSAFRPREAATDGMDLKNVGALNIEVNLPLNGQPADPSGRGPMVDINSANFNAEMFNAFMQATFRRGLAIAIDSPECGASTWYNMIFQAVALGNKEAYNLIYDATDYLTNRHFSKLFPRETPIAQHFTVVHNGWYLDKKNQRRDIRDFDLVALLNHPMGQDRQVVDAWINSYQNVNVPMKVRLHDRYRILSKAFAEVHLTGFSNRIILTDQYLSAALQAAGQAGLSLRPQNQLTDQGIVTRASANLNSNLFGMGSGTQVFNNNLMGNVGNNTSFNGGFAGSRFGWNS